ncbi:MAG TPA: hypothetical protein VFH70_10475 [Acidimicrobiales bacterium]|nr:hypothetical protein [Acidimicrobiales bacterium]
MIGQFLSEMRSSAGADQSADRSAVDEQDEGRHGHHAVAVSDFEVVVEVDGRDIEPVGQLAGQASQDSKLSVVERPRADGCRGC